MRRTTVWLEDEQIEFVRSQGKEMSEYIRTSIDWRKAMGSYIEGSIEMMEDIHPEMTYEQFQAWLLFRQRLRYEGKDRDDLRPMLQEILDLVRKQNVPNY